MGERNHRFDTMRAVLVFLVVFAHMLEQMPIKGSVYIIIYSFHGYALLFVSGYFARFSIKKVVNLLVPYAFLQIIFLVGSHIFLSETFVIQFSTPVWILWYFLVLAVYLCTVPLLERIDGWWRLLFFFFTVFVSIASGFVDDIGYYLSLSRICVFFPFFVAGFYCAKSPTLRRKLTEDHDGHTLPLGDFLIMMCTATVFFLDVDYRTLYGSYSYMASGSDAVERLFLLFISFFWIYALFIIIPTTEVPFFTRTGKYTLPVYALHGFLVLFIGQTVVFRFGDVVNFVIGLILSVAIVAGLGSPTVDRFFTWAFQGVGFARHIKKTMTTDDFDTRPSIFRMCVDPQKPYLTRFARNDYVNRAKEEVLLGNKKHVSTRIAYKLCEMSVRAPDNIKASSANCQSDMINRCISPAEPLKRLNQKQ